MTLLRYSGDQRGPVHAQLVEYSCINLNRMNLKGGEDSWQL